MRIDRERFLVLAISTLAACEHVDDVEVPDARAEVTQPPSQLPAVAPVSSYQTRSVEAPPPPPPLTMAQRWFFGLSNTQRGNIKSLCDLRAKDPCAGWLRQVMPRVDEDEPGPDPEEKFLAGLTDLDRRQASKFCVERSGMPPPTCETPLVVAFDHQPIEFVQGAAAFAFVPGQPLVTDWPSAATPWIARDLDNDGAITSGAELFGSSTALGDATATNGFQALAALDANGDGTVDARDPAFGELLLWTDRDGDHRSSAGELRPLASVITAIPLAHTLDPRCNERGACEGERGTLRWRDATGTERTGAVVDVYVPSKR
jgi:hypothetical protein